MINRVILESRKGKRIIERKKCSRCEVYTSPVYRYAQSNLGVVHLCLPCKTKVFEASFGSITSENENLIGHRVLSGGKWESNRHKF
ncbi:MAG: hypothetical protein AB1521_06795 [Bacteroidota bacterium]